MQGLWDGTSRDSEILMGEGLGFFLFAVVYSAVGAAALTCLGIWVEKKAEKNRKKFKKTLGTDVVIPVKSLGEAHNVYRARQQKARRKPRG